MARALDKRAREYIVNQMAELGSMTTDEVILLIEPHYMFDVEAAKTHMLKEQARRLMRGIRDKEGIRICFSTNNRSEESAFYNVETTSNGKALDAIEKQLKVKIHGLASSIKKVQKRIVEIDGQVALGELEAKQ